MICQKEIKKKKKKLKSIRTTANNSLKVPYYCSLTLPFMTVSDPCSWVTTSWHEMIRILTLSKKNTKKFTWKKIRKEKKIRIQEARWTSRKSTILVLQNKRKNGNILTHLKWWGLKRTSSAKGKWWRIQHTMIQTPTCHKEKRSMKRICVSKRRSKNQRTHDLKTERMDYEESEKYFGDDEEIRVWVSLSYKETDRKWRYIDEWDLQCDRRSAAYMIELEPYKNWGWSHQLQADVSRVCREGVVDTVRNSWIQWLEKKEVDEVKESWWQGLRKFFLKKSWTSELKSRKTDDDWWRHDADEDKQNRKCRRWEKREVWGIIYSKDSLVLFQDIDADQDEIEDEVRRFEHRAVTEEKKWSWETSMCQIW